SVGARTQGPCGGQAAQDLALRSARAGDLPWRNLGRETRRPDARVKTRGLKEETHPMPQGAAKAPMNIGALHFDRTTALIDGRVRIDTANIINVPGAKVGVDASACGALDAADIPFARYVYLKATGAALTAVPIFTDRFFQHQYIYTRTDTGINKLTDLRGRKV